MYNISELISTKQGVWVAKKREIYYNPDTDGVLKQSYTSYIRIGLTHVKFFGHSTFRLSHVKCKHECISKVLCTSVRQLLQVILV